MCFLQLYSREDSSKSNQFFREKYLYLLPIFVGDASVKVYIFGSLSISTRDSWLVCCCFQVKSSIKHNGQNFQNSKSGRINW
jgi:hypothetical protein